MTRSSIAFKTILLFYTLVIEEFLSASGHICLSLKLVHHKGKFESLLSKKIKPKIALIHPIVKIKNQIVHQNIK